MNSSNTTLPRNDDRVTVCPVGPFGPTAGRVKSGAPPDAVKDAVEEYVTERLVEEAGAGWVNEYTAQTAITIMIGIATFSALLRPFFRVGALLFFLVFNNSHGNYEQPKQTLKLCLHTGDQEQLIGI